MRKLVRLFLAAVLLAGAGVARLAFNASAPAIVAGDELKGGSGSG